MYSHTVLVLCPVSDWTTCLLYVSFQLNASMDLLQTTRWTCRCAQRYNVRMDEVLRNFQSTVPFVGILHKIWFILTFSILLTIIWFCHNFVKPPKWIGNGWDPCFEACARDYPWRAARHLGVYPQWFHLLCNHSKKPWQAYDSQDC